MRPHACSLALGLLAAAPLPTAQAPTRDDLGPVLAEAIREHAPVLEDPDVRYVPARIGWMRTRSMELFRYLNRDLFDDATPEQAPEHPAQLAIDALVATRDLLAEHDVEFLVVVYPTRLNVYPESLVELELGADFPGHAPGLERVIARLEERGVEVLDLLPHLAAERVGPNAPPDDQVFLTHNSHWSPKGQALTARLLADAIQARPWYERPAEHAATVVEAAVPWVPLNEPLPEGCEPHLVTVQRILDPAGEPIEATNRRSPVILLGDSFSTIYAEHGADFPRQLAHALGGPVDVIASPGGGPKASRASLARRRDELRGKRLVVWSFASHALMNTRWWVPSEK